MGFPLPRPRVVALAGGASGRAGRKPLPRTVWSRSSAPGPRGRQGGFRCRRSPDSLRVPPPARPGGVPARIAVAPGTGSGAVGVGRCTQTSGSRRPQPGDAAPTQARVRGCGRRRGAPDHTRGGQGAAVAAEAPRTTHVGVRAQPSPQRHPGPAHVRTRQSPNCMQPGHSGAAYVQIRWAAAAAWDAGGSTPPASRGDPAPGGGDGSRARRCRWSGVPRGGRAGPGA